ncbi:MULTISPECIES: hypothetical protein [unclassified Bacillus cereus group]|uniref:hypothetical protein n=1 Tax=unclassified Bacillus cereus group TaxID=2750818 RepID=UPI001F5A7CEC|nr:MULTISPECIES: hypothetical protein [unclassified Bacillus cereus group]
MYAKIILKTGEYHFKTESHYRPEELEALMHRINNCWEQLKKDKEISDVFISKVNIKDRFIIEYLECFQKWKLTEAGDIISFVDNTSKKKSFHVSFISLWHLGFFTVPNKDLFNTRWECDVNDRQVSHKGYSYL